MSFLCIYIGLFPMFLYKYVPFSKQLLELAPSYFSAIYIKYYSNVILALQKILFAILVFKLFIKYNYFQNKILLDFDWLYRKLLRYFTLFLISFIDFLYETINRATMILVKSFSQFFEKSIPIILYYVNVPYLRMSNVKINKETLLNQYSISVIKQTFPFTVIGSFIFIFFIILYIFIK